MEICNYPPAPDMAKDDNDEVVQAAAAPLRPNLGAERSQPSNGKIPAFQASSSRRKHPDASSQVNLIPGNRVL